MRMSRGFRRSKSIASHSIVRIGHVSRILPEKRLFAMLKTHEDAIAALLRAWPTIIEEPRDVFGGESHYQAIVYHCLRMVGVPASN